MAKKHLREFLSQLPFILSRVESNGRGAKDNLFLVVLEMVREQIQSGQGDLRKLGMYEQCCEALDCAARTEHEPQCAKEAETKLLAVGRALYEASGTAKEVRDTLMSNPNATVEDIKDDPDRWEKDDGDS